MNQRSPISLFDDNPPSETMVGLLFHNREREIRWALDSLDSKQDFARVCAVHGETRCGKSHLVLKMLEDLRLRDSSYRIFKINANNQGTARAVLEEIFFTFWTVIRDFNENDLADGAWEPWSEARGYLGGVEPLIEGRQKEVTLETSRQTTEKVGGSAELALPSLFKFGASGGLDNSLGEKKSFKVEAPADRHLVELLRYQTELLFLMLGGKRILLFLDDLDLLDAPGSEGQAETRRLVELLKPLAESPSTVVLVTVRHLYFTGREKEFFDFVHVPLFEDQGLRAIYKLRIDAFNEGNEVFTNEALDWLIKGSSGRVGSFLHRCYELYRHFNGQIDRPIGVTELETFAREQIVQLRLQPGDAELIVAVEKAVRAGRLELPLDKDPTSSGLIFSILQPVTGRPGFYAIDPIYAAVLRGGLEGESR